MTSVARVRDVGTSQSKSMYVGSAIDDSDLDVYEFRVYAHLKRRAQDGVVWSKQEDMAQVCKMSRRKINEVLASLEEKGWIAQDRRLYKGQQTTNLITLLEPPCNGELHGRVTESYTAVLPSVTAKGTPHQGTPHQASTPAREREEKAPVKSETSPNPRSAVRSDDDALRFFDGLAGYGFVSRYRLNLARWYDDYSEAFLKLAWRLAPHVPNCRVPATAFIWLLNREKEWPAELKKLHARENAQPDLEWMPRPGAVVAFKGRAHTVLDTDTEAGTATIMAGADEADSITVPMTTLTEIPE